MYLKLLNERVTSFQQNANVKKYFFNTSWLFIERMIRMVLGLVVGVWVARHLGPDKFGLLSYAQSLVGLFGAVATLGLNSIVVRELIKHEDKKDEILGTSFVLKMIGACLVLLFLFISINIIPTDSYTKLIVFIVASSTIFQSFNVIDFYFQAKVQSKFVVFANFFVIAISTPVKIALLLLDAPLEAFAIATVLDSVILILGLVYYYKNQNFGFSSWKFSIPTAKGLLRDSWPLILSSISISIGMRIDQVMLKSLMDDSSVGFYAVGVKMAEVFNFIPMIIGQSIYPKIVAMDMVKERKKLIYLIRYIFYVMVIFSLLVNLTSYFAVTFLYGLEFRESVGVVDVLIWSIPITYLNIVTSKILLKLNNNVAIFYKQAILAIVNVGLNLILIPKYGIIGAALATLLADSSILFFELFFTKQRWIFFLRLQAILFIPPKS